MADADLPLRSWAVPLVAGLVAVLAALSLPFAPVTVSDPLVSWPQDPAAPRSTALLLSAYQPRELTTTLSCTALRGAATSRDGIAFATMRPDRGESAAVGLIVHVAADRANVRLAGASIADVALPSGPCSLQVHGDTSGTTVRLDGQEVGRGPDGVLPEVDSLVTSVPADPSLTASDISTTVRVNDQFSSSPTPLKRVLTVVAVLAALVALAGLVAVRRRPDTAPARTPAAGGAEPDDHTTRIPVVGGATAAVPGRTARASRWPRIRPVDVVVAALLLAWVFIGPMTDDDGYYSAMARNVPAEGYVGQYYQLFNASFAPFTWYYYALSGWQHLAGVSPVALRIPALVAGLLTWAMLRTLVSRVEPSAVAMLPAEIGHTRWVRAAVRGAMAVAFVPWWLGYDMGVRPEAVVAVLTTATLLLVSSAVRERSLVRAALAFGLGSLAVACHPTGMVAFAPLLVGLPWLWRVVTERTGWLLGRLALVAGLLSAGTFGAVAAFTDSTWYDFTRGQKIFLAIAPQTGWTDEIARYDFLLSEGAMGSYVKRITVLLALLALVWALVLVVAARARRTPLPRGYELVAGATALGFLLLWLTPSKWTHHFGSLAGIGSAFLALTLATVPVATRRVLGERRLPGGVGLAAVVSVCLVAALSFHGPNAWAYSWMLGMPQAFQMPTAGPVHPASLAQWLVGSAVLLVVVRVLLRRRRGTAGPSRLGGGTVVAVALPVIALLGATTYLVGTFAYSTYATWHRYSYAAADLHSPAGCSAGNAVEVTVPATAQALPVASGTGAAPGSVFVPRGYLPAYSPPAPYGTPGGPAVLGSFVDRPGQHPEDPKGSVTSPWWSLPAAGGEAGTALTVMVDGRLDPPLNTPLDRDFATAVAQQAPGGNKLALEFGKRGPDGTESVVGRRAIGDGVSSTVWRTLRLGDRAGAPSDADTVRLVAVDDTAGSGGWLAFSAPAVQQVRSVQQVAGDHTPTALGWQLALWFPCQQQPRIHDGIQQSTPLGVTFDSHPVAGLYDWTWRDFRGGLYGRIVRSTSVTVLAARVAGAPPGAPVEVYTFDSPYPDGAYTVTDRRETVTGLHGPSWGWSMDHVDTTPR